VKRFLSAFIAISFLLSTLLSAMAAESAEASTLRLERITGTVSLSDQSKKTLSCREGMKLLSGHKLSTKASSYAYISLDKTKAVKLDGLSVSTVKKNGEKLELLLSSGKLFFNVTVPLKQDESMEVRTSTMVTGVRGTAGYVEVISENLSRLTLLTGHVTALSYNPVTGLVEPITISAGQSGTFSPYPGIDEPQVQLDLISAGDVPGYVAVEMAKDPKLQALITDQTQLDVSKIIEDAAARLLQDEAKQLEAQKKAEDALRQQGTEVDSIPLFPTTPLVIGGGGGGVAVTSITLTAPTKLAIQNALDTYKTVEVAGTVNDDMERQALVVPAGKTLRFLNGASMNTNDTDSLTINGTVLVDLGAHLNNSSVVTGGVGIQVNSNNSLEVAGSLTNSGVISIGAMGTPGKLLILSGGSLINAAAATINVAVGSLENNGGITNSGTIENHATLTNSGTIDVTATPSVAPGKLNNISGKLTNTGTITIEIGATLESAANLESSGILTNLGTITRTGGTFLVKEGTLGGTINGLAVSIGCNVGSTLYANNLNDIFASAPMDATLKLTANLTLSASATVPTGKILTLDTDVYTITMATGGSITNEGTLTLNADANAITLAGTASITNKGAMTLNAGANAVNLAGTASITNNGELKLNGLSGIATNLTASGTTSPLNNSGSLTLDNFKLENMGTAGAIVNGNDAAADLTLMGDTLVSNSSSNPTVKNNNGKISITETTKITNTTATALETIGGTIELKDTAVIETTFATATALICTGGTINMTGGKVLSSDTGATLSGSSIFKMDGGTVSAPNCGVTLGGSSTLTMTSGLIDATLTTGGIGVEIAAGSKFTLNQGGSDPATVQTLSTETNYAVHNVDPADFTFTHGTVRAKDSDAIYPSLAINDPGITVFDGWHSMIK